MTTSSDSRCTLQNGAKNFSTDASIAGENPWRCRRNAGEGLDGGHPWPGVFPRVGPQEPELTSLSWGRGCFGGVSGGGEAHASARLYSIIETAKANNLEPYQYLRHLFTELPKASCEADVQKLLPWRIDPLTIQ